MSRNLNVRRVPSGRPRRTPRLSSHASLEIGAAPDGELAITSGKLVGVLLKDVQQNDEQGREQSPTAPHELVAAPVLTRRAGQGR